MAEADPQSGAPMDRAHNQSRATPLLPGTSLPASGEVPLAHIYQPARSVMQSAPAPRRWVLRFERTRPPFTDPLMGWTASVDPISQIELTFPDMQSAIAFAERHGWRYEVSEPPSRRSLARQADRFRYDLSDVVRRAQHWIDRDRADRGRPAITGRTEADGDRTHAVSG